MSSPPLVRLGDVLVERNDVVHPRDNPAGNAVFVGLEHIESHTGRRIGQVPVDMAALTGRKPRFRAGDLVYGYLRPYLNKLWVAEFDGLCSVDQYVFTVRPDMADPAYVAWFMRSPVFLSAASVDGISSQLPRIRREEVASVALPLPPVEDQQRIAAKLSAAMAEVARARAAAAEQLSAAKALASSFSATGFSAIRMQDWATVKLGDVSAVGSGITLGRKSRGPLTTELPYLRVANVKDGHLDLTTLKTIKVTAAEAGQFRLIDGDLVLTEGGDDDKLGRGTVWRGEVDHCLHQNHIFRVRLDPARCLSDFAAAQLGSAYGKAYFSAHAKRTTGIASINQAVLKAFPFRLPSLKVQQVVIDRLGEEHARATEVAAAAAAGIAAVEGLPARILADTFARC